MLVAGARRHFDAFFVERARLLHVAHLLQYLAAMEIRGRVIGIMFQQGAEFGDRGLQFPLFTNSMARP